MAKKNNIILLIIGIIIFLLIWQSGFLGNLFSVFTTTPKNLVQWTGIPYVNGIRVSWWDSYVRTASGTSQIILGSDTYRFDVSMDNRVQMKYCKKLPSAVNVVNLYVDNNSCQHWSYDALVSPAYYTCDGASKCAYEMSRGRCEPYAFCGDPYGCGGTCNSPGTPDTWNYHPQVIGEHFSDYGGIFWSYINPDNQMVNYGCYEEISVYKNNILIDTIRSTDGQTAREYGTNLKVRIQIGTPYWNQNALSCSSYENYYILFFPSDSFVINISSPKTNYMQGENIPLNVNVKNNLNMVTSATLSIDYEVDTILGTKTATSSQEVTLNPGQNLFNYSIPTNKPTDVLRAKPKMTLYYLTSNLNGLNYPFTGGNIIDVHQQTKFDIGTVEENWKSIQVIPQAIYYLSSGPCKSGYTLNRDGTYCLSDAISGLSCVITGCPYGYTPPYQCTSSGFCAQTIYTPLKCTSNSSCPTGDTCDIPTGYCINTVIFEKVVQCTSASQCQVPCDGKIASCTNSQCVYTGTCSTKQCTSSSQCTGPCTGITGTCTNNVCVYSGKCITQPTSQTFWDLLKQAWNKFLQWLNSIFG